MHRTFALLVVCLTTAAGCAVTELQKDQDRIRGTLLDLYTDQIMDNLVRTYNKQAIVQLSYSSATAMVTVKDTLGGNDNLANTNTGLLTRAAAKSLAITKATVNTATGNMGLDHSNQVWLTANPVTASDDVYDAYVGYLAVPGSLKVTCDPPPSHAAHLCKRCGHLYYWVPVEYQRLFLELALKTTAQRGQAAAPPDAFYTVNLVDVIRMDLFAPQSKPKAIPDVKPKDMGDKPGAEKKDGKKDTKTNDPQAKQPWIIIVKMDKSIPIDSGFVDISSANKNKTGGSTKDANAGGSTPGLLTCLFGTPTPVATDSDGGGTTARGPVPNIQKGATKAAAQQGLVPTLNVADYLKNPALEHLKSTHFLAIYFDPAGQPGGFASPDDFRLSLLSQPLAAKVFLQRHRPQAITPNEPINRVEGLLQQIQLNQNRLNQAGP